MKRWVMLFALAGLTLLISAGPAAAHNVLIGSDPADGARLAAGPPRISLTFNLPVQPGFTTVTVTGPDGNQWQAGPAVEDEAVVSVPVRALGPAGEYTVGYRVLSADGHPVQGVIRFVLTIPGTGTPEMGAPGTGTPEMGAPGTGTPGTGPPAAPQRTTESGDPGTGGDTGAAGGTEGTPVWPWLLGAGALVAAGVVVALRFSRST